METKSTRVYYLIRFVLWCSENIILLIGKLYLQSVARARYYDNNIKCIMWYLSTRFRSRAHHSIGRLGQHSGTYSAVTTWNVLWSVKKI